VHHPRAEECDRTSAVSKVIEVTGDSQRLVLCSVGLLAADAIGAATVMSALLARGHVLALGLAGLLLPAVVCWLVTGVLALLSEWPVSCAFGRLRAQTGAPVDPSAPWSPLGVRPLADSALAWDHVVPLIAAATIRQARARRTLTSAIVTTVTFFSWMALSLAVATLA
jgi:hypothetical protein